MVVVFGITERALKLPQPPCVRWQILLVFTVDCIDFAIRGGFSEKRRNEKLTEPIECPFKVLWSDVKVIVGVVTSCVSIRASSVLTEELAVFSLVWVFLRAKEHYKKRD